MPNKTYNWENSETKSRLFGISTRILMNLMKINIKKVNMMKLHTLLEFVLLPPE